MKEQKHNINDWLSKLQQESWNLELLVSGFSIFLLLQSMEGLNTVIRTLTLHFALSGFIEVTATFFIGVLYVGSFILITNLILHVFLRGFWIGAIGLRSVQEKIDFEGLGYSSFFTKKLKQKVAALDTTLEKLDTISSVIFSFTFLIVFMLISVLMFFVWIGIIDFIFIKTLGEQFESETVNEFIESAAFIFMLITLLCGLIYFIDTLSLGFFKRYKWLSKIYYPIYTVIGFMTMAGIYRSIYYSLVNRFPKNQIRMLLGSYLFLIFMIPFNKYDQYILFPDNVDELELSTNIYDDLRSTDDYIDKASIPSQMIDKNFLPLFIRYNVGDNEAIQQSCNDLQPLKNAGFNSGFYVNKDGIGLSTPYVEEEKPEQFLECLSNFYTITLDTVSVFPEFHFYTHPQFQEKGIYTLLDLEKLERGKHHLHIIHKVIKNDSLQENSYVTIPFWKTSD